MIAAPHTSNWDFPLMLSVCFTVGIKSRWIGKHTLFPPVVGTVMYWLGGISIDRRKASNTVEQMREYYHFHSVEQLTVLGLNCLYDARPQAGGIKNMLRRGHRSGHYWWSIGGG